MMWQPVKCEIQELMRPGRKTRLLFPVLALLAAVFFFWPWFRLPGHERRWETRRRITLVPVATNSAAVTWNGLTVFTNSLERSGFALACTKRAGLIENDHPKIELHVYPGTSLLEFHALALGKEKTVRLDQAMTAELGERVAHQGWTMELVDAWEATENKSFMEKAWAKLLDWLGGLRR